MDVDGCLKPDEFEAFVAGEMSPENRSRVETHIASCSRCRLAVEVCRQRKTPARFVEIPCGKDPDPAAEPTLSRPVARSEGSDIAQTIEGYEILHEIHRGGQGIVYKAVQRATKRMVALKVLLHGPCSSAKQQHRFEREVDLVASLRHPNIVTIYDSGQTQGNHFFAMEYIHGKALDAYLSSARLNIDERLRLFKKICIAVSAAHQRGVIHRDLKPGNILVDANGEPHVLDFGLAKAAGSDLQSGAPVTMPGEFMGTLAYASPEQTKGDPSLIDTRTDVYSLGVILFEMLTGTYPYEVFGNMAEVLQNIADAEPTKPSTIHDRIDDEVETIVLQALAKEKERRYQTAEALGRDVGRYLVGEPLDAKRDSTWYVIRKSLRRHRVAVAVAAAFVVLLAASTVALWIMFLNQSKAREEAVQSRILADRRYEEIIRLADIKRLSDARVAADQLWPAHPEKIAAMEAWLNEQARPLQDNLPMHTATLDALRAKALEYDAAQQARDRETHPSAAKLAELTMILPKLRKEREDVMADQDEFAAKKAMKIEKLDKKIAENEQRMEQLTQQVQKRRTWELVDETSQWQHDTLTELVEGLTGFVAPDPITGILQSVEDRLAFASGIEERSVSGSEAAARWAQAIADIDQLEVYGGLQLAPQMGLLPLRRDPDSGLWEFWHVQTGIEPQLNPDAEASTSWMLTADTGLVFVLIPGGTFWMGAQPDDVDRHNYDPMAESDEYPVHQVTLDPFFISKYEMTQSQWLRFTGVNPSSYGPDWIWIGDIPAEAPLHQNCLWNPVELVSWSECDEVMRRLGLMLPTEAQWEYAARGGTRTAWWSGDDKESIDTERAGNLADGRAKRKGGPTSWRYEETLEDPFLVHGPVGSLRPNGFGLHDTIGNVREWCRDFVGDYPAGVQPGDGFRESADTRIRAIRGGSYDYNSNLARSANRTGYSVDYCSGALGLRPARTITKQNPPHNDTDRIEQKEP